MTSIGKEAFYGNPLTDSSVIKISSKITSIGEGAFRATGITVLDLSAYTGKTIPAFIARGCGSLVSVSLPSQVTEIGREAFRSCKKITGLTLPNGIEQIGAGAFAECALLKKINLPGSVTRIARIDYEDTWKGFIALGIFQDCPLLKTAGPGENYNINLQWGAGDALPSGTFNAANKLERVVIPNGMTGVQKTKDNDFPVSGWNSIGTSFGYATSLKSVTLPESFTEFDYNAFQGCSSLETVNIPKGTRELQGTFIGCSSLKSIRIPDGMTVLNGTFGNCTSLTTVKIPDSVTSLSGSLIPSARTFEGCKSLTSLNLPASVTDCDYGAFKDSGLISAGPPESGAGLIYNWTDKIPDGAFWGMNLQTFYFADGIAEIGEYAFCECTELKSIVIPETVKILGENIFKGCKGLTTIKLPKSLTEIGRGAFTDCTSLKNINFRGDAPKFGYYIFSGDTLTAYYPKDNKTWTREVRQSYGGKVKWKPYVSGKAVDTSKERSVTLNGGGTASARFFLLDEKGDALDEQEFTFVRRANGKIEEFGSFGYMTDFDGGYTFSTPYYSDPSKETKDDAEYEVTWTDASGKKQKETFILHVTVKPATYTETWTAGFGAELSASGNWLSAGHEGESVISLVHKGNKAQDLILGINLSDSAKSKLSDKLEIGKGDSKFEAVGVSGAAKATQYSSYATMIPNFDPDNRNQQKLVTEYLSLISLLNLDLTGTSGKVSVLCKSILGSSIHSNALKQFEISESGIKVNISSGSTALTFVGVEGIADETKLGAMNGSTTYSTSEKKENGITTISAGVSTSESRARLSGSIPALWGETGLYGYHKVNSVSAFVQSNGTVSYQESDFASGDVEEVGYDELLSATSYKVSDGNSLINENSTLQNLSCGSLIPVESGSLEEIGDAIKKSDLQYSYSVTDTLSNTYSWSPKIELFKNSQEALKAQTDSSIKPSMKLGLTFSYKHGWKTETDNGTIKQDTVLTDVDSSSSIRQARNDKDSANLGTVLNAAMKGVVSNAQDAVGSVVGSLGGSIRQGLSSLTSSVKGGLNWEVGLFGRSSKATSLFVESYAVETVADEVQAAAVSAGNSETAVTANTVGEAVLVYVTDSSTGKEVTDLSVNPMKLSIQYTEADLAAAGADLSKVKDLGLYRYDEKSGAYVFVESTLDENKKQFTATISKTGEYVLICDGAAPAVTDIRVSDRTSQPVITASVTDISGVTEITMSVDGEELVNKDNFTKYYNAKSGIFTYKLTKAFAQGSHTVVFRAKDQKNQSTEPVSYEFKVNSAPKFTEITVPKYVLTDAETISVLAKVSSESDEKLMVSAKAVYCPESGSDREAIGCRMTETKDGWTGTVYPGRSMSYDDKISITFTVSNENGDQTSSEEYLIRAVDGSSDCYYEDGNMHYRFDLATNTMRNIFTEDQVLTIPETIDGIPVYRVELNSLEDMDNTISKIVFPATVKKITTYNTDSSTIVIRGYTNSGADYFAQYYNLKFESMGTVEDEGTSGGYYDLDWTYRNDGTLTISGTGEMGEWYDADRYSWYPYHEKIRKVVIQEGVTSIGRYALGSEYKNLTEAVIPKSVTSIGYDNFRNGNCTILGYYGSEAYDYAKSNSIAFKAAEPLNGTFGEGNALTWIYDGGKLTISGKGAIPDYTEDGQVPWGAIKKYDITEVVIENGITGIGAYTFADMDNTQKWSLPDTLTSIGAYAFLNDRYVIQCVIPSGVTEIGEYALGYRKGGYGDNGYDPNLICAMTDVIIRSDSPAVKSYGEKNKIEVLGISEKWNLAEICRVEIWSSVYYDEGKPVRPDGINVWDSVHRRGLTENIDYELAFENNTEVGDATAILTGIGLYEGTIRKTFRIRKPSWYVYVESDSTVSLNVSAKVQYYTIKVGGEYGQLKFTSDDNKIKVDKNGKVTIPANYSGTFKITVEALETERYDSDWDSVTFVVKAAHVHSYGSWKVTRQASALAAGQKKRTCTGCGNSQTASIAKLKATIRLKASSLVMKKGQTTTAMSVYGFAKGDYLRSVKAANSGIVQVSSINKKGTFKLKARTAGKTTIRITLASGLSKNVTIRVQNGIVRTTRITGVSSRVTLKRGKALQLRPVLTPITSQERIIYTTSNNKIVTVSSSGKITAKKKGSAVITVKSGRKSAKITVTVK